MPMEAQMGDGGTAPAHSQLGYRRWLVSTMLRPLYPGKETRYPLHRRLGDPRGRYRGHQTFRLGIRSPDRPARSNLLYRLRYDGRQNLGDSWIFLAREKRREAISIPRTNNIRRHHTKFSAEDEVVPAICEPFVWRSGSSSAREPTAKPSIRHKAAMLNKLYAATALSPQERPPVILG
jgi:hypothetical protein